MRGLVGFVVFLVIALAVLAYGGVHVLLPALVEAGVRSSPGFAGQPVSVTVRTSVQGVLLHGWIDEVSIHASGLREPSMAVGEAQATLTDVGLAGRTFASIDGTLRGVTFTTPGGDTVAVESMRLSGTDVAIQATGQVSATTLATTLQTALHSLAAAQVTILPGEIRLDIAGEVISAKLLLDGGGLVLDAGRLGKVDIVHAPSDGTWMLTSVVVSASGADLTALIRPSVFGIGR